MKRFLPSFRTFLIGVCLLALPLSAQAEPVDVLPKDAKIVSIGGALTEIVYALGAENRLIGRDKTSIYPEEAKKLPDIGYMRTLSAEGIFSVAPEGILLVEGSGPQQTLDILNKASIPMVVVPDHYTIEGVLTKIKVVGKALQKESEAQKLAAQIKVDFDQVEAAIAKITKRKKVLFVLTIQNGRIMAAGQDTAADGVIRLAGGQNAVQGFTNYKLLNDEALLEAAPDVILMMSAGGRTLDDDALYSVAAIQETPAGKTKNIVRMDGLYLLSFGPRTAFAIRDLAKTLYPDEFKTP